MWNAASSSHSSAAVANALAITQLAALTVAVAYVPCAKVPVRGSMMWLTAGRRRARYATTLDEVAIPPLVKADARLVAGDHERVAHTDDPRALGSPAP